MKRLNEKYGQLNEIVTQLVADVEQHKGTLAQMSSTVDHLSQVIPRYESILAWPFNHSVTLSLISQENPLSPEAAITHKFVPNPESSSFHQPRDTFNVASGFPEFAPLGVLNETKFVKNDTIYFRVKLDAPESPTALDVASL